MSRREWTQAERLRDRMRKQAEASREAFHGTHRGASLASSPTGRTARGAVPAVNIRSGGAHAATLTVEAENWEVFNNFEGPVEFTDILRQNLVDWSGPSNEIVWPIAGTVFFYVEGAWDDLDPGETYAEVLVDGVPVWNVWINSSPAGLTVTLEAVDVEIADDDPTVLEFTVVARNQDVNVSVPTDEIVWPVAGVIQAYVHGRWDVLDDPAQFEFELLVDDEPVWPDL